MAVSKNKKNLQKSNKKSKTEKHKDKKKTDKQDRNFSVRDFPSDKKQKKRKAKEGFLYWRKLFHFAGIMFPLFWTLDPVQNMLPVTDTARTLLFVLLFFAFVFQISLEYLRFHFAFWQKLFVMTARHLLKNNEDQSVHGSIPYFFANLILVTFVQREVAIVSMVFLIVGDPMAAYFGSRYGKWRFPNGKSFQGSMAAVIGAILSGSFFLWLHAWRHSEHIFFSDMLLAVSSFIVLAAGALAAFSAELFSEHGLRDDNLTIPLSAALVISLFLWGLQIPESFLFFSPARLFSPLP